MQSNPKQDGQDGQDGQDFQEKRALVLDILLILDILLQTDRKGRYQLSRFSTSHNPTSTEA